MSCFCGTSSRQRTRPPMIWSPPTQNIKTLSNENVSREVSLVSAVSCLETQSTAAYSPRAIENPILMKARERREVLYNLIIDSGSKFTGDHESNGVRLWYIQPENEPLISKGHISVQGSYNLRPVLECLTNANKAREWNADVIEGQVINEIINSGEETLLYEYNAYKGRMGFPGRDFLWYSYIYWESADVVYYLNFSDESQLTQQTTNRYVRGNALLTGYRIERTESGLSIHFVNQVDVGIKRVPDWIVNTIMRRTPERLGILAAYLQKHFDSVEHR